MPGAIKSMIDRIVEQRSHGNPALVNTTKTKLILKGIDPAKFNATSPDDPEIMSRVKQIALELNVNV